MPADGNLHIRASADGLTVVAHRGVGATLLGFDLDPTKTAGFAGFAIDRTDPQGRTEPLLNRISFTGPLTKDSTPPQRRWTTSHDAPFQLFRWVDVPPDVHDGTSTYTVTARYFANGDGAALKDGASVQVAVPLLLDDFAHFKLGFTRGYLSSQAYVDHFHDANGDPLDFRVRPNTLDYDTAPFQAQYRWLGFSGRALLFDFLDGCAADPDCLVDFFAYDLDEPDLLARMEAFGPRLRAVLDNAPLHTKASALEPVAKSRLEQSAGADHIVARHFKRFSHCKVIIQKDAAGTPLRVLAGSANFSVRGLYAQANNLFVYDDPVVADLYEQAFVQAFDEPPGKFAASPIAADWHPAAGDGIPASDFCFSPHQDAEVSLGRIRDAINGASSSVLYAVMQFGGGGVTEALAAAAATGERFCYGVIDTDNGSVVVTPASPNGLLVPFAFLKKQVPWPFHQEFGREAHSGLGAVIHDKFVVVDFNGEHPQVFFGSSNLAGGGEVENGDSLVSTSDPIVVSAFAVEAVRLIDHFHFRAAMQKATHADPLVLRHDQWWAPWFDETNRKSTERQAFTA